MEVTRDVIDSCIILVIHISQLQLITLNTNKRHFMALLGNTVRQPERPQKNFKVVIITNLRRHF